MYCLEICRHIHGLSKCRWTLLLLTWRGSTQALGGYNLLSGFLLCRLIELLAVTCFLPDCSCLACSASHSIVMLKCTSWIECTALCFKLWYWVSVENSPVKMITKMTDITAGMPQTPSFCQLYTFGFSGQGKLSSSFHWKCHSSLEAILLFIYFKIYLFSFRFRLYILVLLYNSWKIIRNFDMTNTAAFKVWVWQMGEGLG